MTNNRRNLTSVELKELLSNEDYLFDNLELFFELNLYDVIQDFRSFYDHYLLYGPRVQKEQHEHYRAIEYLLESLHYIKENL